MLTPLVFALAVGVPQQTLYPYWPQPIVPGTMIVYGLSAEELGKSLMNERTDGTICIVDGSWVPTTGCETIWLRNTDDLRADQRLELLFAIDEVRSEGGIVCGSVLESALLSVESTQPFSGPVRGTLLFAPDSVQPDRDVSRIELPADCAIVIEGRRMQVYGSTAILRLQGFEPEPLEPGRQYDLIALKRRGVNAELDPFPTPRPDPPIVPNGKLFLVGGGELRPEMLKRFVEAAGGKTARIVVIPVSFSENIEREPAIVSTFQELGAGHVSWIHTKDRNLANSDPSILNPLREATGIWFGGGRQWNLVDSYHDTAAHELMLQVLERGGAIGGSSAGASIQAEVLARGDPLGNSKMLALGYLRGLGFLQGAIVDQHFSQRERRDDLVAAVRQYPNYLGIGIDESTMLVIEGSTATAYGENEVWIYDFKRSPQPVRISNGESHDVSRATVTETAPLRAPR